MFKFYQISSLEKVFLNYKAPKKEFEKMSVLKDERFSYQIAYTGETDERTSFKISVKSKLKEYITIREVGNVPVERTFFWDADDDYETKDAGLFPDPLFPMQTNEIYVFGGFHSIWITVDTKGEAEAGVYPIEIIFESDKHKESKVFTLEIVDAYLPEQELIYTQWFHTDCIASVYNLKVFSKKHWELIEKFVAAAVKNGINTILTPVFTPPLDTEIGGERPTVQLVDVEKNGSKYIFDFSKLKRWIDMLKRNGVKYIEISHLFTQWGAKAAPKITAKVNGKNKRIFGWDTPSDGDEYKDFLNRFLPELIDFLKREKVDKNTIFHISDEPSEEHKESYLSAKNVVKEHLKDFKIIDALSEFEFYKEGIVENPVPIISKIEPFLENGVKDLWTYYCCVPETETSNRFISMPSHRNRVIGMQLYKYDIAGFLQWGYNFYYSQLSKEVINPFITTDAKGAFPAGDAFCVYPGKDGPVESLRICVFYDALQDMRAMKLLESYAGKDFVVDLIEKCAGDEITFKKYPKSSEFILKLREKINNEIKKYLV